jgi:ArsR family transcriptional regulator
LPDFPNGSQILKDSRLTAQQEKEPMREYLRVMKAVADGTRVKILKILQHRELCVCEIQNVLGISQPSVSRHLRLLEEADLVRGEKDGMWSNFRLVKAEEQNAYSSVVLAHLRDWLEDDPQIQILMERTQSVDREKCTAG